MIIMRFITIPRLRSLDSSAKIGFIRAKPRIKVTEAKVLKKNLKRMSEVVSVTSYSFQHWFKIVEIGKCFYTLGFPVFSRPQYFKIFKNNFNLFILISNISIFF